MFKNKLIYFMIVFSVVIILSFVGIQLFLKHPKFGSLPTGERKVKIEKSPNYKDGSFVNLNHTPQMTGEGGFIAIIKDMINAKNRRPKGVIPSVKTDLFKLDPKQDVLIWFGHSSYFIQIDEKKILVDPVFCGNASPFKFMIKSFKGTDIYKPAEIPDLDYLIITHDHWDHLDYETVVELKPRVGKVITGLGTGAHLEKWGYDPDMIIEKDWYEKTDLGEGFSVDVMPARHFTGRGPKSNQTLWASFVFQTPTFRMFIGGDGGYDEHFAEIGERYGGFDLAILENGQYNTSWKYIHLMPEQGLQAAKDLKAKRLFPVHSSKFALANHSWDEPLKAITEINETIKQPIITPKIGEPVYLKDSTQVFSKWWVEMK